MPWRACCSAMVSGVVAISVNLQLDHFVLDGHRERVHRLVGGKSLRLARPDVEQGAVPGALYGAQALVELTLREWAVVVRAAVLDRVELTAAVEHADLEVLPLDQLPLAGLQLGCAAHVDDFGLGQVAFVPKSYQRDRISLCSLATAAGGTIPR